MLFPFFFFTEYFFVPSIIKGCSRHGQLDPPHRRLGIADVRLSLWSCFSGHYPIIEPLCFCRGMTLSLFPN